MSLVAAAVSVLFVVSAIVAVRGWPGIDPQDDVPRLVLSDGPSARPGAPGVALTAPVAGATPIVLGDTPAPAGAPGTGPSSRGPAGTPAVPGQDAPAETPGVTGAAPSQASGPGPRPPAADPGTTPIRETTGAVAETVRDTGAAVGGTVDTVAPGGGEPIRQTATAVADVVEQVGGGVGQATQAVGHTAQGVTDTAGQVVTDVGAPRLGEAVQGTGRLAGALLGAK
jgi:hypothetical protein